MLSKFKIFDVDVSEDKRQHYNSKVVALIRSRETEAITQEEVFNLYTGKGGLHGLKRADFVNYYHYSEAKKEFEKGQFFTPAELAGNIVNSIRPQADLKIADLTCGAGVFFNFCPKEENCYGNELDKEAAEVSRFIFPAAKIENRDFVYYSPEAKMDIVLGNPPFNLKTDWGLSQLAYIQKAEHLLNPGGLLVMICPKSFLADDFSDKGRREKVDESFDFILQSEIPSHFFAVSIETKVMYFQKKGLPAEAKPYENTFISFDPEAIYFNHLAPLMEQNRLNAPKLYLMGVRSATAVKDRTEEYILKKLLWDVKCSLKLKVKYYEKALNKLSELRTQKKPEEMPDKDWEQKKLTAAKIIGWLKRKIAEQDRPEPVKKLELVKTNYGLKYKAYHRTLKAQEWYKSDNDILLTGQVFPEFGKLYRRKTASFQLHSQPFEDIIPNPNIVDWLEDFTLNSVTPEGENKKLNERQISDTARIFSKKYGQLAWHQGSGKTLAGSAWVKYHKPLVNNSFIICPALALNLTWKPFLQTYGMDHRVIKSLKDLELLRTGEIALISFNTVSKYKRHIQKLSRSLGRKIAVLIDESDELTSYKSQRTQACLACFRKASYKLLTTGTTTRNNIGELYGQYELLYNNSVNFINYAPYVYRKDKEGDLIKECNLSHLLPFKAYRGESLFKDSYSPQRTTVFGIQQDTQDVFNSAELADLISKTTIHRTFEQIVGEKKHTTVTHRIVQSEPEKELYSKIIAEFYAIWQKYYNSTGNAKKDSGLAMIRQIGLLIKSTSVPHLMPDYTGNRLPEKFFKIRDLVSKWDNKKVAIGTVYKTSAHFYLSQLTKLFPDRPVFYIDGEVNFAKRQYIITEFEATTNGILISTQGSLKSSVNIPGCDKCIIESLQWNIPKIYQYAFRFIRFDSAPGKEIHFVIYEDSIEANVMALLLAKERLNDFVKTRTEASQENIFDEFGIDTSILQHLITKAYDEKGHMQLRWGKQTLAE